MAVQLGCSPSEATRYDIGELAEDMVVGDDVYLRGAIVLPLGGTGGKRVVG